MGEWIRLVVLEAEPEDQEPEDQAPPDGAHGCVPHLTWPLFVVLAASVVFWIGLVWLFVQLVRMV